MEMKIDKLRKFLHQYPIVYIFLQKIKQDVNDAMIRFFGLGYVERVVTDGPIRGLKFIAAKRVFYSKLFWNGTFEKDMCTFLYTTTKTDDVCYDIGSNLGYHALLMADAAKNGHVYAFEPIPQVCKILQKNIDINHKRNVTIVTKAVVREAGSIQLGVDKSIDQAAVKFVTQERNPCRRENIACDGITLDGFVEAGHRPPSLLKIDVEGAEVDVLQGGRGVLMKYHPTVFCEIHGDTAARGVFEILLEHRYELFTINIYSGLCPIRTVEDMPKSMDEGHVFARIKA